MYIFAICLLPAGQSSETFKRSFNAVEDFRLVNLVAGQYLGDSWVARGDMVKLYAADEVHVALRVGRVDAPKINRESRPKAA